MTVPLAHLNLPTESDTANWAARLAPLLAAGDTILLSGHIGAGKSAFARALIWARIGRNVDVPSPTFTLVQTYQADDVEIWHCDLYRLTHPDEAVELGLEDAFEEAICLIEWPDRLGPLTPANALSITLTPGDAENARQLMMHWEDPKWTDKLGAFQA